MRLAWPVLVAALATTASAPPLPAGAEQRTCFYPSEVSGFGNAGPDRALVRIGFRETWELTLSRGCPDVNFALDIGIRARGGERICPGRPAELLVPYASGSGFRRCLVTNIRKLTPEEAAAARGEKKP